MAGIKSLKTDPQAAIDGVWVSYPANSDGTVPRFKIARTTMNNPLWKRTHEEITRAHRRDMEKPGGLGQEKSRELLATVFAKSLLKGWENIQPNDDGENLEFSEANAIALFCDPVWSDLWDDMNVKTNDDRLFREEAREKELKN